MMARERCRNSHRLGLSAYGTSAPMLAPTQKSLAGPYLQSSVAAAGHTSSDSRSPSPRSAAVFHKSVPLAPGAPLSLAPSPTPLAVCPTDSSNHQRRSCDACMMGRRDKALKHASPKEFRTHPCFGDGDARRALLGARRETKAMSGQSEIGQVDHLCYERCGPILCFLRTSRSCRSAGQTWKQRAPAPWHPVNLSRRGCSRLPDAGQTLQSTRDGAESNPPAGQCLWLQEQPPGCQQQ
mmetsp:Transcript_38725/g.90919  ORF Transcript_38725/g.90919 Transcript_38725/m.90919 type:complete len:238 (-) Transcript_38725:349-1062(-)